MGIDPVILDLLRKAQLQGPFEQAGHNRVIDRSSGRAYFVKLGRNVDQIKGEAESLRALYRAAPGLVPSVVACESVQDGRKAAFVSEYLDMSRSTVSVSEKLAGRMASELHNSENPNALSIDGMYGFPCATHCGDTEQDNSPDKSWLVFFRDQRIRSLCSRIHDPKVRRIQNMFTQASFLII